MKRAFPLALAAALLAACVAETVERRRPRKGPVKEVGFVEYGGGHVRYSAEGWGPAVASRRRTALRLMRRNCGRELEPRIVDEYARQDADAPYAGQSLESSLASGGEHYTLERYVHLVYECRVPGAPEVPVSTAPARGPTLVIPAIGLSTSAAGAELATPAAPGTDLSTAPVSVGVSSAASVQEPPK